MIVYTIAVLSRRAEIQGFASLRKLAERHLPDKTPHLLDVYEPYLRPLRQRPVVVLELGVKRGGSIRLWREYFSNGQVFGLDNRPGADRIPGVMVGDQANRDDLARVAQHGPFDLIIDDASHQYAHQQTSLLALWEHLNPLGLYVIEDVHTSYTNAGRFQGGIGVEGTTIEFLKRVMDDTHDLKHEQPPTLNGLASLHVHYRTALLRKRDDHPREHYKLTFRQSRKPRSTARMRATRRGIS